MIELRLLKFTRKKTSKNKIENYFSYIFPYYKKHTIHLRPDTRAIETRFLQLLYMYIYGMVQNEEFRAVINFKQQVISANEKSYKRTKERKRKSEIRVSFAHDNILFVCYM